MKKTSIIFTLLILLGSAINAQQITQQFTFSQSDVQITQSGDYDLIRIADESYLQGEENAGKPLHSASLKQSPCGGTCALAINHNIPAFIFL